MDLKDRFLDKNGDIDYEQFKEMSQIPKPKKYHEFRNALLQSPNCISKIGKNTIIYQTPAGQIKIYIPYAYGHFSKSGKHGNGKEDRHNLTGALNLLLDKPAFVTKDTQGTLYFYKPLKSQNDYKDIISISIDKNGKLEYRTTYADKYNQVFELITKQEIVYIEN